MLKIKLFLVSFCILSVFPGIVFGQQDCPFWFEDNFNDGNDIGWYVHQPTFEVIDGEYVYQNGNDDDGITTAGDMNWSNYVYEFKFKVISGSPQIYMIFRFTGLSGYCNYSGYNFQYRPNFNKWALTKSVLGGGITHLAWEDNESIIQVGAWYHMKTVINGNNIKCYVDDILKIEFDDNTHSQGSIGIRSDMSVMAIDDVKVSPLPPEADAGENMTIKSLYQCGTVINGKGYQPSGLEIFYRWLEGDAPLSGWTPVHPEGNAPLDLCTIPILSPGEHKLTLEIKDICQTVKDDMILTISPTLAPVCNKTILWPPNHKMVDITINTNAGDNGGGPITLTASVSSNEPQDGLGDGDTAPDWTTPVIDQETGIITLQLRAERSGKGNGRVYTITITATDASDNSCQAQVEIVVPHSKRK